MDPHGRGQQYAFDLLDESELPFLKQLDQTLTAKKRSSENDYDSDCETVKRAKNKMQRDLRQSITEYLEKGPRMCDLLSLKRKPRSV